MQSAFKHVALFTPDPDRLLGFYQKTLGFSLLRRSPSGSLYTSDGLIMCAMLKHREGTEARWIGYDHFGFHVSDLEEAKQRVTSALPNCRWGQRPQDGRYAEYRFLDMDGHPVDVSVEGFRTINNLTPPTVRHVAIEASDPAKSAAFYKAAFDLKDLGRSDTGVALSDGTISLSFVRRHGTDSCKILRMGFEVTNAEKAAAEFPSKKALEGGKFEVQDVDGNTLELAPSWQV
ncbi:MAG: VOC family protein [Deltaproteobacteria bacterium]|nr:VOC family protein [Deltaproteobacteria bacterium]